MGCGQSNTKENRNIGVHIIKCDVSKVNKIPEEKMEEFKQQYLSDVYIHEGEEGFKERMEKCNQLMFQRWEWLLKNVEIYVNMLRAKGFSDDCIQACIDGKRPLSFKTEELHREFCMDLKELGKKLESELKFTNVWFVQTGSSVPGFSNNPCKGIADRPSKITDPGKSDVDIVIVADGVKNFVEEKRKAGIKIKEYPCVCSIDGKVDVRYGNRDLKLLSNAIAEWAEKWSKKLGGGVQVTLQNGNPFFPPWELAVPIHLYDKNLI
jgi:hypothetical protein